MSQRRLIDCPLFEELFPFHLSFDADERLIQVGRSMAQIVPEAEPGATVGHLFKLLRPRGVGFHLPELGRLSRTCFILEARTCGARFRGQIALIDEGSAAFVGSPWVTRMGELRALGLRFDDFAVHDTVIDFLTLVDAKEIALAESDQLRTQLEEHRRSLEEMVRARTAALHAETEHRLRQEEALFHAQRLATLGQIAAGVGHEINTPLTFVLLNQAELSRRITELAPPHEAATLRELLADNDAGLEQIAAISRELRAFARLGSDCVEGVDLNDVVRASCHMLGHQIRHTAALELELGVVPPIAGDRAKLTQAVSNLLTNACDAIGAGAASDHHIRVRTGTEAGAAWVAVADSGPGTEPETLRRLFEPFVTTKGFGRGTGLGLAITREIARAHGGDVTVTTTVGEGSEFMLRVALRLWSEPRLDPVVHAEAPAPTRVLVIEDEPALCRAYQRVLAQGHEVDVIDSGAGAIRRLSEDARYDVILCDLMMPEVDGVEFYRWLEQHHPSLAGRTIFVSGGATTARTAAFVRDCPRPVLPKPVKPRDLHAAIAAIRAAAPAPPC